MANQKYLSLRQLFEVGNPRGGRGDDLFSTSKLNEAGAHLCVYDDESSIELPTVIVPADDDLESFFADIATYFPSYAPISAYVHVLNSAALEESRIKLKKTENRFPSRRDLSIFIGLILGDALSNSRKANQRAASPSYSACKRTLAYCIARSAVLHPHLSTQDVSARWLHIRELSGMDGSTNTVASMCWITDVISGNFERSPNHEMSGLAESLFLYFKKGATRQRVVESLISLYPKLPERAPLQYEAYERRIEDFNAIVNAVRLDSRGSALDSMCIAFFCNLILPGSLAHSGLVERLSAAMPDCMLWYGLFAGASEEFSLTSSAGGVGQKLLRDLVAPFDLSRRPTSDISLDEYEVLSRVPLRSEMVKPTQAKAVLVSLYPGVDVYVRSVMEEEEGDDRNPRSSLLAEQNERVIQVRHLLAQADQLLSWEGTSPAPSRSRAKISIKTRSAKS